MRLKTLETTSTMELKPALYLLPSSLSETDRSEISSETRAIVEGLNHLVAEDARTTRRFLGSLKLSRPIASFSIAELNEHTSASELSSLLEPLRSGSPLGMLSEAGCPCVGDPGTQLVHLAHTEGRIVKPLAGPSSFLLALMASGLSGQAFVFHGYVPKEKVDRTKAFRSWEKNSRDTGYTQIFMDTPYRSVQTAREAIDTFGADLWFSISADLTGEHERCMAMPIAQWRKLDLDLLNKLPCVFVAGVYVR